MLKETDVEGILENCRALINQITAALSAEVPFLNVSWVAELQLHLEFAASALEGRTTPVRAWEDKDRPHLSLTVPRLRTLPHGSRSILGRLSSFLSEDIDSVLKRSAKICQQCFVKQLLGPFLTEFALNLTREGATSIQRGFHGGLLPHI